MGWGKLTGPNSPDGHAYNVLSLRTNSGGTMAQSTLSKMRSANAAPSEAKSKRRDIQGLRALAVIAVISDHLVHWPSGGFVGVDVFFVLSGFLITGLLLREHDKSGSISFADFYRRRIRRIMPAATVVLATTAGVSFLLLNASRGQQILADSVWAFFFSANWHFAAVGTDYFQASGLVSPVQHFWSLAVEEQFYFVWPWLMLLIFWLAGSSTKWDRLRAHRAIGFAMLAIVVASFAWALSQSVLNPTGAYFSTFTRAWELGVGALIAVLAPTFKRIPSALRPVLAWLGIVAIVWSLFGITADMLFPAPWAAAPVLATALVIAAGTGGDQRFMWPLTNRISGYVGDISYSLYLWHFPVIILAQALLPSETPVFYLATVICMFALSVASFHLVEERVRHSEWLLPKSGRRPQKSAPLDPAMLKYAGLGVLAVVTALVCGMAIFKGAPTAPVAKPMPVASAGSGETALADTSPQGTLTSEISAALAVQAFPDLNPSIDSLGIEKWSKRPETACMNVSDRNIDSCATGAAGATRTVAVLGDSFAVAWLPGIRAALEPLGYTVQALTMGQCPAAAVQVTKAGGAPFPECTEHLAWAVGQVATMKPELTILASAQDSTFSRLASGNKGTQAASEIASGLQETIAKIGSSTSRIAVLSSPPEGRNLQECVTKLGRPSDCVTAPSQNWQSLRTAESNVVNGPNLTYVDTSSWFCVHGSCPGFVGNMPVRVDSGHLTVEYSVKLAPLLADAVQGNS